MELLSVSAYPEILWEMSQIWVKLSVGSSLHQKAIHMPEMEVKVSLISFCYCLGKLRPIFLFPEGQSKSRTVNILLRREFEVLGAALYFMGYPASIMHQLTSQNKYLPLQEEKRHNKNIIHIISSFKKCKIIPILFSFFFSTIAWEPEKGMKVSVFCALY